MFTVSVAVQWEIPLLIITLTLLLLSGLVKAIACQLNSSEEWVDIINQVGANTHQQNIDATNKASLYLFIGSCFFAFCTAVVTMST